MAGHTKQQPVDFDVIRDQFKALADNHDSMAQTAASERRLWLQNLENAIWKYRGAFHEALALDYKKPAAEVDLIELYPVLNEIRFAKKNLKQWMKPERVASPITLLGSSARIQYEPKGTILVISPWNFPVNLSLYPLVSALASGNTVMLKPSEYTPHTSQVLEELIKETFPPNMVNVVQGDGLVAGFLTELPFNHIFFTGSTATGKKVMEAAAKNLASVTLELGGKSPLVIDKGADADSAAKRVAWAKSINNGQVCISPDYALVHETMVKAFVEKVKHYLHIFYSEQASSSEHYGRIVNSTHWIRLNNGLKSGLEEGATILHGGGRAEEDHFLEPTIVLNLPLNNSLMTDEIFGPILPVYTFSETEEVIHFIHQFDKPLTLHIYSRNKRNVRRLLRETSAGATTINHSYIHFFNPHLPFGGVNHSGIGKGHGKFGFIEFSNARAISHQHFNFSLTELFFPPYSNWKKRLLEFAMKWL